MGNRVHKELLEIFKKLTPMDLSEEKLPSIRVANKLLIQTYIDKSIIQEEYFTKHDEENIQVRLKIYVPVNQTDYQWCYLYMVAVMCLVQ